MKKILITLVALLAGVTLAASVFAFGPGWGRGHGGGMWHGGGCYGSNITSVPGMNLTAEQITKINALRDACLKDIKPLQDKMFSKRGDLKLLWLQTNPDQKKITETHKEARVLRDQMEDKMTSYHFAMLNVLTPQQRETLKAYGPGNGFGPGKKGRSGWGGGPGPQGGGCPGGNMRGNW